MKNSYSELVEFSRHSNRGRSFVSKNYRSRVFIFDELYFRLYVEKKISKALIKLGYLLGWRLRDKLKAIDKLGL